VPVIFYIMSTEIENLVAQVKQATNYQNNKLMLRERIQTDLHMTYENGLFKITPELLAFVATWPAEWVYLEDTYQNPIEIEKQVFLVKAQQHYQKVMNEWQIQHDELKRIRKV
jgi:hypothetical protein